MCAMTLPEACALISFVIVFLMFVILFIHFSYVSFGSNIVLTFEKSHSEDCIFPVWGDWLRRYVRIPFRLASSLIWCAKTKQVNCFFLCWLYLIINTKTIDILFYGKKLSRIFNCANLARFDWNCGKNKNVLLFGSSIYSTTVKPKKQ